MMFENGNVEATAATVRAGLAVTTWLVSTVPADLETLAPHEASLPTLPSFADGLQLPTKVEPARAGICALRARNDVERCCGQTRTVS